MIRIEPFRVEHLDRFAPGAWDKAAMERSDFSALAKGWEGHDQAAAMLMDDQVLAIGGIAVTGSAGLAWIFASDELRSKPVFMHKMTKHLIALCIEFWGLTRVVAEVPAGFSACHRWVSRLGFSPVEKNEAFTRYEMRA